MFDFPCCFHSTEAASCPALAQLLFDHHERLKPLKLRNADKHFGVCLFVLSFIPCLSRKGNARGATPAQRQCWQRMRAKGNRRAAHGACGGVFFNIFWQFLEVGRKQSRSLRTLRRTFHPLVISFEFGLCCLRCLPPCAWLL